MAALNLLPTELINQIVLCLEHDRLALHALAAVNRRLNACSHGLLFRHADNLTAKQRRRLAETLGRNPGLNKHVRSYGWVPVSPDGYIRSIDYKVVDIWPNLKTLQLEDARLGRNDSYDIATYGEHRATRNVFASGLHEGIESVHFNADTPARLFHHPILQSVDSWLPSALLRGLLQIPTLRTFTVTQVLSHNSVDSTHRAIFRPCNIEELEFRGIPNILLYGSSSAFFGPNDLQYYLGICPHIKILRCVDIFTPTAPRRDDIHFPTKIFVQRSRVTAALDMLAQTVEDLTWTISNDWISEVNGPPVDFTRFEALKSLNLAAAYLLPTFRERETWSHIYYLLPSSIEVLRLNFSNAFGIFHILERYEEKRREYQRLPGSYEWLRQFPFAKSSKAPRLRKIILKDSKPLTSHVMERWTPPKDIADLYQEAGIELVVISCKHVFIEPQWKRPLVLH